MGFESFNTPPPEQEPKKIPERIPSELTPAQEQAPAPIEPSVDHENIAPELPAETPSSSDIEITASPEPAIPEIEQPSQPEERESIEDTRFIRESLESVSDSIDRVGWALKDRGDKGLNEFYSPNIRERLGASAHMLREIAAVPELATEDITTALDSTARAFEDFGSQQPRGSLREDPENLRRLGSSIRLVQDSLLTLSSRLTEHQEEPLRNTARASARVQGKMENAVAAIARRHAAVDRYLGKR